MDLREYREGEAVILAADGELNTAQDCAALERRLSQLFEAGSRCLVLDCEKTARVSAAAIRLLLIAQRRLDQARGCLVLCGLGSVVERVFAISGFDRDFAIARSRAEAVARATEMAAKRRREPAPLEGAGSRARRPVPETRLAPETHEPPAPSPLSALAAEIAGLLAGDAPPAAPRRSAGSSEEIERLSAQLMLALAAHKAGRPPGTAARRSEEP